MELSDASNRRRLIAGFCLIAAPALLLVADVMQINGRFDFEWTVVMWISFVLFVPAVLGIVHLLRNRADYCGLLGGALVVIGAMAGAGMMTIFRLNAVLKAGGEREFAQLIASAFKANPALPFSIFTPGPLFPLGFIVLAVGLYQARIFSLWMSLVLALGGVLFPVGHAVGVKAALIGGDLLLLGALAWLGWRLLSKSGTDWEEA